MKDAFGSVNDAVGGAIGKAIGPGAVTEKTDPATKADKSSDDTSTGSGEN